jgi:hypothetical protein
MLNHVRSQRVRIIGHSKALRALGSLTPATSKNALRGHPANATKAPFMDLWITAASEPLGLPLTALVQAITSQLKPKARADATKRRVEIITTIIANFLQFPCIAVNLKREKATRYSRQAIKGEQLTLALMELEELGLIAIQPSKFKKLRTALSPTAKLNDLIGHHRVTPAATVRIPNEEIIILKKLKKPRTSSRIGEASSDDDQAFVQFDSGDGGIEIDYEDDNLAANTLRSPLRQYNQFLSQSSIHIEGSPSTAPFAPFKRIFTSDGTISFNLRGRLHRGQVGGWTQNLPKEQRPYIRINGEPVCDLDFTNMHLRLAYRETQCSPPDGDLYGIEGLEGYRSGVKKVCLAMIAQSGPMTKLPRGTRKLLPKQWNGENLSQAILQHHHAIAHIFGKGNSHHFTFLESEVLMETLCRLMNQHNVPALPMHDGLMVQESKRELAMRVMQEVALDVLGVVLPVEQKAFNIPL